MSDSPAFIDSNIWLYAFIDNGDLKHQLAAQVIQGNTHPVISSQVVSEVCVNMLRKAGQTESFVRDLLHDFYSRYEVVAVGREVQLEASCLRERYSLSYWDSMICSAAIKAECKILISEDMQHGLKISERLEIVNPFA